MNELQTVTETEELGLIGLPTPLLKGLSNEPGFRQRQDFEILRACAYPMEMGVFPLEKMRRKLEESCLSRQPCPMLMVYAAPGDFLARQFGNAAGTLRSQQVDLEVFARNVLAFWRAYHTAMLEQYRAGGQGTLLLNGDRVVNAGRLQRCLTELQGGTGSGMDELASMIEALEPNPVRHTCETIVAGLTPECLELYREMERLQEEQWHAMPGTEAGEPGADTGHPAPELLRLLMERSLIWRELGKDDGDVRDIVTRLEDLKLKLGELESRLSESEAEKNDLLVENGLLLRQMLELQEEFKKDYQSGRHQHGRVAVPARTGGPGGGALSLWRGLSDSIRRTRNALLFAVEYPLQLADDALPIPGKDRRQLKRKMKILTRSGFFDKRWYLQRYPDVAAAGRKPAEHYLNHGAAEGRNPGPDFDTLWYLRHYPDVADAGVNPLLHYIQHGRREGRLPRGS